MTDKRLIEVAFPLREASIDSVHEKNVRHGHISTLHIWPARRPLAACRAALIATLLPDPGDDEERKALLKRLGGTLRKTTKKKKMPNGRVEEIDAWETDGGVLHWGRESGPDMDWFREEIRKAYGGRAPRMLDPFAGGGAIPLEAMRLGCEVTAADINPVAWFILKCTLEYPQRLAGQTRRLPDFAIEDPDFMAAYLKARGLKPAEVKRHVRALPSAGENQTDSPACVERGENLPLFRDPGLDPAMLDADLAWHVRAWGRWVLKQARRDLASFYPTYAEYCALKPYRVVPLDHGEPLRLVPTNDDGEPQIDLLNAGFEPEYLENPANPRWVAKPTVAYLWARTVRCKACRATVPLLKTRWLAKKNNKRVLLTLRPNVGATGVVFGIEPNVPQPRGNAAQRREHDKRIGAGTMSRAGARCPCCDTIMTMADLRLEGRAGRLGAGMTAVVMDGPKGKEYRLQSSHEMEMAAAAEMELAAVFAEVPFGLPTEPTPRGGGGAARAFSVDGYGFDKWWKLFSQRQVLCLGRILLATRDSMKALEKRGYVDHWQQPIKAYMAILLDRIADRGSSICHWDMGYEKIANTFSGFRLPISWDFAESSAIGDSTGSFTGQLEWVSLFVEHALAAFQDTPQACLERQSATSAFGEEYDLIVTDPPYYDAIPYSDLMDFFHIWLRRALFGLANVVDLVFSEALGPKWDSNANDGELIDDSSRFGGDKEASRRNYEAGMSRAFSACHAALKPGGRLVIVFAHKRPDAWETLVSAIIKAGFVVDGSWPIQTEMGNRTRALSSAALSSSVWLVCRKRDPGTRPGWDTAVLKEMEANIIQRLRDFWDAGIRGPDFVWAATGPALEAYSRYPVVKKTSQTGNAVMDVSEFLGHVRRIVVDFVVGRVLSRGTDGGEAQPEVGDHPLDDVTTYYLLHRSDFGLKEAPAGPCILYAISCGLSERELVDQYGLLARGMGGSGTDTEAEEEAENEGETGDAGGSGGKLKLKPWKTRTQRGLGEEPIRGRAIPLIDHVHRLLQLWAAADVTKVNAHLDRHGLRRGHIFTQLIQALIEQSRSEGAMEECAALERLANHLKGFGSAGQGALALGD
jgi:putative DNA methylase